MTINGSGFTGATEVQFGSTNASSFAFFSDTQLTAVAPAGSAGTVDVTVTTPSGTSATGSPDHYTYVASLYVANEGNSAVTSFISATGAVNSVFGTSGVLTLTSTSNTPNSPSPAGVGFDLSGNIYVTDLNNAAVWGFNPTGTAANSGFSGGILQVTSATNTPQPNGIAFDSSGFLYVTDVANATVLSFTTAGLTHSSFGSNGVLQLSSSSNPPQPFGLAFDSSGNLYVSDNANGTVLSFNDTGTAANSGFGSSGVLTLSSLATSTNTPAPNGITFDSSGNLYVADSANAQVWSVNSAGTGLNSSFGSSGILTLTGGSSTPTPVGVGFDASGNFYVSDAANNTITSFNSAGTSKNSGFGTGGVLTNSALSSPNFLIIH